MDTTNDPERLRRDETSPRIGLIWAEADGGVIGRDGGMPWHLPEDLGHFKTTTLGSPVIMGRRTWESLPERTRPLPGRQNIVVTRDGYYSADGADVATSLQAALALAGAADPVWVIGGGELFRSAMPIADELSVTRIALDVSDGDAFAPSVGPEWRLADAGEQRVSRTGLEYRIERWVRADQHGTA